MKAKTNLDKMMKLMEGEHAKMLINHTRIRGNKLAEKVYQKQKTIFSDVTNKTKAL